VKYFIRVLHYLRPYRTLAVCLVLLIVAASVADLLGPWPLKILVDNVLGDHPLPEWMVAIVGPEVDLSWLLGGVVLAGLLITLIHNGLTVLNNYVQTTLEQRMVLDFRSDLFQHAQRLSMSFHDQRRSGTLIYAINSQGDAAASLIMTVPILAQSMITLIGMFLIVWQMDEQLALLSTIVMPLLFHSVRYYAKHIESRLMKVRGMEGESLSIVHEAISMLRVIVAFGRESYEYLRFRSQGQKAVAARVDVTVRQTLFSLVVNMTTALGTAAVTGLGAYKVLHRQLTVGDLLIVLAYIAAVYKPLETMTYTFGMLQDKFTRLKVAFGLLDTQVEVKEVANPVALGRARGRIEFRGVDFSYTGRQGTLAGISLVVQPGQTAAIVGPTGAGKTTLISLIPRFYDVKRGTVLIDDQDIRQLSLKSLRDQISIVLQEPLLFSGTIADNIRYGRLDASDEEIVEAARSANAHDFIIRLPKKYETELGERGVRLSGGERQRLCVARAFLKDAPILILDEPTSAIDSKTEAIILDALDRLMVGRTSFMIAHRLSTIHRAGVIFVLEHGRLVQQGAHDELLAVEGLYRQLHDIQNRGTRRSRFSALELPSS
jgi:ATP-binding cassette subfamily B protein/subfamily B ATP-binding cassette protein MsbA